MVKIELTKDVSLHTTRDVSFGQLQKMKDIFSEHVVQPDFEFEEIRVKKKKRVKKKRAVTKKKRATGKAIKKKTYKTKPKPRKRSRKRPHKRRMGITDKVLAVISTGTRKWTPEQVTRKLHMRGDNSRHSVYNALVRLKYKRLIGQSADGKNWAAIIKDRISKPTPPKQLPTPPKQPTVPHVIQPKIQRKGKEWSKEEGEKLGETLKQVRGRSLNDWQLIADIMGRSRASCAYHASVLGYTKKRMKVK